MADTSGPSKQDTTARDEGTAAHWLANEIFKGANIAEFTDRKSPNGVYITPEICEIVEAYLLGLYPNGVMELETSFLNVAARADHITFWNNVLYVDDLKTGWRFVEPEQHWTLIAHAIGWMERTRLQPLEFVFVIHQPRPHHHEGKRREWRITPANFMRYRQELLEALSNPSDHLVTGPHCHKCHAIASCPAAVAAQYNAIDAAEMAFDEMPDNVAIKHHLDVIRRAQSVLKSRLEALEEMALHRIKQGEIIQDHCAEIQYTNRNWKPGLNADLVKILTNVDVSKPGMLTPAQAEKAGISEATMKSLTERRQAGVKLVKVSANKRVNQIFKNLEK